MKIAIVSKSDSSGGGAGRSAETLTRLVNENGHIAHHWLGYANKPMQSSTKKLYGNNFGEIVFKSCRLFSRSIGLPDFLTPELFLHLGSKTIEYDLYHFQDISSAFSPISLRWLAKKFKVIWTFRDCSPFTGGCIYPLDCESFKTECQQCPQLGQWPLLTSIDLTGFMHKYKRETVNQTNFQAVTPSDWLANEAMKSQFFCEKPVVIHNSVNCDLFKPLDKISYRIKLNLPCDKLIVLISSMDLESKFKGTAYALSALSVFKDSCFILAVGKENSEIKKRYPELNILFTGVINDDTLLSQYYAISDFFIFTTLADNLPNVVLETMACGVPCIAFKTGGVPEMIDHGKTGWLVEPKDIQALIAAIEMVVKDKNILADWSLQARIKAKNEFNETILINKYLEIYNKVLLK